jgi:hypothetical protein
MRYQPTVNREQCLKIADLAANLDIKALVKELRSIAAKPIADHIKKPSHTWQVNASNLADWLVGKREAPYKIFTKDNKKMKGEKGNPFYIFSALPLVTCPGAGDCKDFCYSLKAWRYPQPFFRQVQNTVLILQRAEALTEAFNAIPEDSTVRLYVDGDIDSVDTLDYWFSRLNERPSLNVYGYSKSWKVFLDYKKPMPKNYVLNLSSGSRYDVKVRDKVAKLPVVRESFIAIDSISPRAVSKDMDIWTEYSKDLRSKAASAGLGKVFVCPGKCGSCTGAGHACGNPDIKIPIVIGVH